jgi:hypothetical protein
MNKTIGTITTYRGTEHGYLRGHKVRIIAVLHNAAKPDLDEDGPDYFRITHDEDLKRAGGVTRHDRIEVQPWLEKEGRFSFVTSDPLATDLGCFKDLPAN